MDSKHAKRKREEQKNKQVALRNYSIHLEKLIKVINDLDITFPVSDKLNANGKSSGAKD